MIRALVSVAVLLGAHVGLCAEPRVVAFERGTSVWVTNLDGSNPSKIASGTGPDISPDGSRLAFHTDSSTAKAVRRYIAVADVATRKVTLFKTQIPSDNCQRAVWSPDGTHLIFSLFVGSDWHLALIDADGSGFRYVKKAGANGNSFWSTSWAPDGRSFYAQDLNKIYQFGLDGAALKTWDVGPLFPKAGLSSASRLVVSPDGKNLLLDVDMDEEVKIKDWDGPVPALWTLNLMTEKATRLTAKGGLAWCGCWISAEEILYVAQGPGDKDPSIYRMSSSGKDRKLVIKNGHTPSVSR